MEPQRQDVASPGGQSPSLTTQRNRESVSGSDIEMMSLVSAEEHSDQIYNSHENYVNTVAGDLDPTATPNAYEHRPRVPNIDSRCKAGIVVSDKRPSLYNRLVMDTWICEIIAMVFSIGCIVAIAFTVGSYNGGPVTALPSGVTLNAFISILSTGARAALFFVVSSSIGQLKWCLLVRRGRRLQDLQVMDEASRGPLGAIKILAKWTGGPLASLGALITICMIAFSPFLQQLVTYPTGYAEQPELKATIPRAVNYTLLWDLDYSTPNVIDALFEDTDAKDAEARSSLLDWISANDAYGSDIFAPSATCPPRPMLCTWENYKSVGWCSKCRKATGHLSQCIVKDHRIQISNNASHTEYLCQVTVHNTEAKPADNDKLMQQHLSSYNDPNRFNLRYQSNYIWVANISTFVADDTSVIEQPVIMLTHASISAVEDVFQDLYHSDQPALRLNRITECVLTFCEREYVVKLEIGDISSTPVSIDYGRRFESDSCWRPNDSADEVVLTSSDGGRTRMNETERAFCPVEPYYRYFSDISPKNSTYIWRYNLTHSYQPDGTPPTPARTGRDMDSELADLATSLTNYGTISSNQNAIGKALSPIVTVRARWQWITLPALLQLASAALFFSTVLYSRYTRVSIWKSSLLAIYYHQIDGLQENKASLLLSDMDKASNDASVQISRSGDDRGFVVRRIRDEGASRDE